MRVSRIERKTNVWVLENIKPEWTLDQGDTGSVKLFEAIETTNAGQRSK